MAWLTVHGWSMVFVMHGLNGYISLLLLFFISFYFPHSPLFFSFLFPFFFFFLLFSVFLYSRLFRRDKHHLHWDRSRETAWDHYYHYIHQHLGFSDGTERVHAKLWAIIFLVCFLLFIFWFFFSLFLCLSSKVPSLLISHRNFCVIFPWSNSLYISSNWRIVPCPWRQKNGACMVWPIKCISLGSSCLRCLTYIHCLHLEPRREPTPPVNCSADLMNFFSFPPSQFLLHTIDYIVIISNVLCCVNFVR